MPEATETQDIGKVEEISAPEDLKVLAGES